MSQSTAKNQRHSHFFATKVKGEYTWLPHRTVDGLGDGLTTAHYYYYPLKKNSSGNCIHSTCCATEIFAFHSLHFVCTVEFPQQRGLPIICLINSLVSIKGKDFVLYKRGNEGLNKYD